MGHWVTGQWSMVNGVGYGPQVKEHLAIWAGTRVKLAGVFCGGAGFLYSGFLYC